MFVQVGHPEQSNLYQLFQNCLQILCYAADPGLLFKYLQTSSILAFPFRMSIIQSTDNKKRALQIKKKKKSGSEIKR
jgi:hypothetical protein